MADKYTKVYISMPRTFLDQLDNVASEEHLSRSAIIREAVKLYMEWRSSSPSARFFGLTETLRKNFECIPDEDLENRIDRAVARARRHE
jgi:metal-responsive CopG/Arc/MetJ family transcriptional regulator